MLTTLETDLQYATPESQGIPSAAILKWVEAVESQVHEFHSFILARHGKIVAEGWWSPCRRETPHMLFSLSKSFTSTAVGLAVSEGRLSIDDPVLSFFPEHAPAEVSENLAAMRVRHLLSMSTGHDVDTMPRLFEQGNGSWVKGFFDVPVLHEPGTHFLYNTGASYTLSAIVQKVTGQKLVDYLKPRLFEPLGIEDAVWEESPQGINMGGFGLTLRTSDIARFGQLYLQKGMWNGKQILPEAWVEQATSFQVSNATNSAVDWQQGYGFQFWRCRHNAYRGDGAFGQYCIVMPEQDAVLALTGGLPDMQIPLTLVWDILLAAMSAEALPDDTAAQGALTKKLSSLSFSPVQGKSSSPVSASVSGKTYKIDENELKIESIRLNTSDSGPTFAIKTAAGEENIPCGNGGWQEGETRLFNDFYETEAKPIASSAAWTSDDRLTMVVRLYKTPFFHMFDFHFDGENLKVETRVNVGFEPPETKVMMGQRV